MPKREILIANRHPRLRLDRRSVVKAIHTLDSGFDVSPPELSVDNLQLEDRKSSIGPGELSLVFLTDVALAELHADFLDDPSPTDVITFSGNAAAGSAGEICVSVDAAVRQVSALSRRPSIKSISSELTLYLVHGWLHLAGCDDLQPARKRQMRRAEARAMVLLKRAKALPVFSLKDTKKTNRA